MRDKKSVNTRPPSFGRRVEAALGGPLRAEAIDVLQVNLGYRCTMTCPHCHVAAGPGRLEMMGRSTVLEVLRALEAMPRASLDITGGSPELHDDFLFLVEQAAAMGTAVSVRSNLTILAERERDGIAERLARCGAEIIASLPHFEEEETDRCRGAGTFRESIKALKLLNALGYGKPGTGLCLSLAHNPSGAVLPRRQDEMEAEYRDRLDRDHGIVFSRLFVIVNMPLGRFRVHLEEKGLLDDYVCMLAESFNPGTLEGLMCRRLISVAWDGRLYDCDFNQMAGCGIGDGRPQRIGSADWEKLAMRRIAVGSHCFGCTAREGSS